MWCTMEIMRSILKWPGLNQSAILGFTYKEIEAVGVIMPVVEMQTKYLRPAHYDDLLTIKTILRELTTDHRIIFEHEVYNPEKKLLTLGKVILYFVKMGSFEKTTMPETMRRILHPFFQKKHEILNNFHSLKEIKT